MVEIKFDINDLKRGMIYVDSICLGLIHYDNYVINTEIDFGVKKYHLELYLNEFLVFVSSFNSFVEVNEEQINIFTS